MKENKIFSKVFMWLFVGLLITFATGYLVSMNENMLYNITTNGIYWIGMIIVQIGIAIWLSVRINKMEKMTAIILYLIYSLITGITFSLLFAVFNLGSIIIVFGIASIVFAVFALIGHFTKIDLTRFGSILGMLLLGLIIAIIVNAFIGGETSTLILSWIGLLIFLGFTAYDIQVIKKSINCLEPDKAAIIGAFTLYLDFINIFIDLLNIFGQDN